MVELKELHPETSAFLDELREKIAFQPEELVGLLSYFQMACWEPDGVSLSHKQIGTHLDAESIQIGLREQFNKWVTLEQAQRLSSAHQTICERTPKR